MKTVTYKVTILLIVLTVETQCGVIDNIFGKVKNTTKALGQDVKNVWSYSKSVVGLETATEDNRPEEEKRGLIGGVLHSTREKLHNVRNYFWNTDAGASDAGVIGNLYNRVKNRIAKIKGTIKGGENSSPQQPPSENEKLIQKTLNKLFFSNGTRLVHGRAFQEAINNLRRKLHEIRSNITGSTEPSVNYGEGLIDVRIAASDIGDTVNDNVASINNEVYDKVEDGITKARDATSKFNKDIKDGAGRTADSFKNDVSDAANNLNNMYEKASDAVAKENELLRENYNKATDNGKQLENKMEEAVDDAKRLIY